MKKVLSVLLAALLCFSIVGFAFAAEESTGAPIVYVYGFGRCTLTKDIGTKQETAVFPPNAKTIATFLLKLVKPYAILKITGDYSAFGKALAEDACYLFDGVKCNENGNSVYDVAPKEENTVTEKQEYGQKNYFYSDWRKPVTEAADELNDYINAMLEATGKTKVCLICESMGGSIGVAYLKKYGHEKCSSIIMDSVAVNGVRLVDEIYLQNFTVNGGAIVDYIKSFAFIRNEAAVSYALSEFDSLGGFELLLKDIVKTLDKAKPELYSGFFYKIMAKVPGLWSFVTSENFEKCKALAGIKDGTVLADKINEFNYEIRPLAPTLFKAALNDGVKLAIISGYNLVSTPLAKNVSYQSDFLIGTKETSFGANCADLGSTLGDGYVQKVNDGHDHLSSDGIIDASCCALAENTWFAKNTIHTVCDERFFNWVAYTDGKVDIYSNSDFPQFLIWENKSFQPLGTPETAPQTNFIGKAFIFVCETAKKLISKIPFIKIK